MLICTVGVLNCTGAGVASTFCHAMSFDFHQAMSQARQFIGLYTTYYQGEMDGFVNLRQGHRSP